MKRVRITVLKTTLDQELADKIDGILAAHGEDPTLPDAESRPGVLRRLCKARRNV